MTVLSIADRKRHLAAGETLRRQAAVERKELQGAPRETIVAAITEPTDALAVKRLGVLFAPRGGQERGLIPRVSEVRLRYALGRASKRYGRRLHDGMRLRELTAEERRRVVDALVDQAPKWWREKS